jgi:RHS repeat-associated protein
MFSTKRYDVKTGLSSFGYRFYSPAIGKWITKDPIEEEGGINLYAYVLNNPINRIDPLGTISKCSSAIISAVWTCGLTVVGCSLAVTPPGLILCTIEFFTCEYFIIRATEICSNEGDDYNSCP